MTRPKQPKATLFHPEYTIYEIPDSADIPSDIGLKEQALHVFRQSINPFESPVSDNNRDFQVASCTGDSKMEDSFSPGRNIEKSEVDFSSVGFSPLFSLHKRRSSESTASNRRPSYLERLYLQHEKETELRNAQTHCAMIPEENLEIRYDMPVMNLSRKFSNASMKSLRSLRSDKSGHILDEGENVLLNNVKELLRQGHSLKEVTSLTTELLGTGVDDSRSFRSRGLSQGRQSEVTFRSNTSQHNVSDSNMTHVSTNTEKSQKSHKSRNTCSSLLKEGNATSNDTHVIFRRTSSLDVPVDVKTRIPLKSSTALRTNIIDEHPTSETQSNSSEKIGGSVTTQMFYRARSNSMDQVFCNEPLSYQRMHRSNSFGGFDVLLYEKPSFSYYKQFSNSYVNAAGTFPPLTSVSTGIDWLSQTSLNMQQTIMKRQLSIVERNDAYATRNNRSSGDFDETYGFEKLLFGPEIKKSKTHGA